MVTPAPVEHLTKAGSSSYSAAVDKAAPAVVNIFTSGAVKSPRHPFMDDPENLRIGRVGEFVHPRLGRVREVALPLRVDGTAMPPHQRAPELGEHTDSILSWAGYSAEEIADLHERGAVS